MMNSEINPVVTIMIATKDRPSELCLTLGEMLKQRYAAVELLIIDDGSATSVEPLVRELCPAATVIYHEESVGQCLRRNQGFSLARGKYILQLDDDCSFTAAGDLEHAVCQLEEMPQAAAVSFYVVNSLVLPEKIATSGLPGGSVASFMGAAVLLRKAALDQTRGYRTFFGNDWEEEELGLQLLSAGWRIVFAPQIVAHHRLSPVNRNSSRTWMRGLRNRTLAMVIHMPFPRVFFEVGWKVMLGAWDAVRLLRITLFLQAMSQTIAELPAAWRLRHPLSATALRRYDLLRLHAVITPEQFDSPTPVTLKGLRGFWSRWQNRARNASVWDSQRTDIGSSSTVLFAHETEPNPSRSHTKKTV